MSTAITSERIQTLDIRKEVEIDAPVEVAFEAILAENSSESQMPDGTAMPFVLEAWPGGRWFRDLGKKSGHLWGHVQVIKPPTLLELCGPMFMSYPATNFVQYRLTATGKRTKLAFTHRAIGLIPEDHMKGVQQGWEYGMNRIREIAERLATR